MTPTIASGVTSSTLRRIDSVKQTLGDRPDAAEAKPGDVSEADERAPAIED